MRTALFTLLLLVGLSTAAQAQMKDRHSERPGTTEPAPARVDELTRQMSRQLRLNEAQYIQLRAINKVKLARMDEIQWEYQNDPARRNALLMELESQYENECSRILTPSQLTLLREEQKRDSVPTQPVNSTEGGIG
ncbi:hypothetical protein [Hymenobacter weizhouensis]|uniref:hypothetical protein n=1 Tax=Hymenobacter sp. YIM 151500-1 TaxID=2987689 RepID=UPI00222701CF|nr:hypothetical protein [Hymenobacter sp. YIM 151500-1]UYZ64169.1 hypothetical protein OIS53_04810 [Hymenobacter sp. YIM 151500-1]